MVSMSKTLEEILIKYELAKKETLRLRIIEWAESKAPKEIDAKSFPRFTVSSYMVEGNNIAIKQYKANLQEGE